MCSCLFIALTLGHEFYDANTGSAATSNARIAKYTEDNSGVTFKAG
jgi:hypothetical protein